MLRVGVLVSGGGTNLQAMIDQIESGKLLNVKIVTVVSNRKNVYALERAVKANIDTNYISRISYDSSKDFNQALIEYFNEMKVDLVVMAGYLVVLGDNFIKAYRNRIINIHPSLIPAFSGDGFYGIKVHEAALKRGVKISGATVHFVDEGTDTGPIIGQKTVVVKSDDTPKSLQKRIMEEVEWELLPMVVGQIADDKIKVDGNVVYIKD